VAVLREDGFEGLKKFLPPPSRRALVLCDPSYEVKSDYARVPAMVARCPDPLCHRQLCGLVPADSAPWKHTNCHANSERLAVKAQRPWLNASLTVKSSN